jgi:hypothetical protein
MAALRGERGVASAESELARPGLLPDDLENSFGYIGFAAGLSVPSETVIACPVMVTRSRFNSTPTSPDRGDAWRPTSDVRPSLSAQ